MRFLRLLLVIITAVGLHKAHAQQAQGEPDEFLDDDEPFDEAVDGKDQKNGPRPRGPSLPKPPVNEHPAPSMGDTPGGGKTGDVSFHLIEPPKYWQPKKRHHRNEAKDQKALQKANVNSKASEAKP